jgi:hypothetical protein
MFFKRVLEPLLKECKKPTIERIRGLLAEGKLASTGLEVSSRGDIRLNRFYERISGEELPFYEIRRALKKGVPRARPGFEDEMQRVKRVFSAAMDACYPIIEKDIGSKKLREMISEAFSDLLRKHGAFLHRYGMMEVLPKGIELPGIYRPPAPGSYLLKERTPEHAFRMFRDMVGYGLHGLCISTSHPTDVKHKHEIPDRVTLLWLSKTDVGYAISPLYLGVIRDRISAFVSKHASASVLLDGLEYLITINGFDLTLKFLHDVREIIVLKRAVLVIPVNPATLEPKQLELLERYITPLEAT